jgi:hypothetical protein
MDHAEQVAARIRQLGVQRMLFGSDGAERGGGIPPREAWALFLSCRCRMTSSAQSPGTSRPR